MSLSPGTDRCLAALHRAVLATARRLLVVGHAEVFADSLRQGHTDRDITAVTRVGDAAFAPASVDVVVIAEGRADADLASELAAARRLLSPHGWLLVLTANPGHHAHLSALLCGHDGVPQSGVAASLAMVQQAMLDAGLAPD